MHEQTQCSVDNPAVKVFWCFSCQRFDADTGQRVTLTTLDASLEHLRKVIQVQRKCLQENRARIAELRVEICDLQEKLALAERPFYKRFPRWSFK